VKKHKSQYVSVTFDISARWEGLPPAYRIYIGRRMPDRNHMEMHLFSEREWRWPNNIYLEETLQILAPPGDYRVILEAVEPCLARFRVRNYRTERGNVRWLDDGNFEIGKRAFETD